MPSSSLFLLTFHTYFKDKNIYEKNEYSTFLLKVKTNKQNQQ